MKQKPETKLVSKVRRCNKTSFSMFSSHSFEDINKKNFCGKLYIIL